MKFGFKTIAAAVALAAASMGAQASIQASNGTGGSELVFYAFDTTDAQATPAFVMDLGMTFDAFVSGKTYSFAGSNNVLGSAWNSYKAAVGNDLSTTVWGVFAAKAGTTLNTTGGFQTLTTAANLPPSMTGTSSSNFTAVNTLFGNFITVTGDASATSVNNAYFTPGSDTTQDNWGQVLADRMGNKLNNNFGSTANAVGVASNMYLLSRGASPSSAVTRTDVLTQATNQYQWQFDGSTVFAAPVPEPESYALMLAGLALVGSIARRRSRA